ncbi:MAG TPA: hypothetical protein VMZ27_00660, partial [Candidatus Saccharimonadales bacterium]|nr:hypothetical protein [Candidatus Saccharimonadales bacterium]
MPRAARLEIIIPWRTIYKIFAAAFLVFLAFRLWKLGEVILLALLLAVAFRPVLEWTRRRGW